MINKSTDKTVVRAVIVSDDSSQDVEMMAKIANEINTGIDPHEILSPNTYYFERHKGEIIFVYNSK